MQYSFCGVYIMGNDRPTLYVGVTNNLLRRVWEHKKGTIAGFTQKYNLKMLLYYEFCENIEQAIVREKQIKNMKRSEKLNLIKSQNPLLSDISKELFSYSDASLDDVFGKSY